MPGGHLHAYVALSSNTIALVHSILMNLQISHCLVSGRHTATEKHFFPFVKGKANFKTKSTFKRITTKRDKGVNTKKRMNSYKVLSYKVNTYLWHLKMNLSLLRFKYTTKVFLFCFVYLIFI